MLKLTEPDIDDCKKIWIWRNLKKTRIITGNERIIPWEEHVNWFKESLKNNNRILLIAKKNNISIGVVRFDEKVPKSEFEIGINIDPSEMKKGYGKKILTLSIFHIAKLYKKKINLIAKVKEDNLPSKGLFNSLGFKVLRKEKDVILYKLIVN